FEAEDMLRLIDRHKISHMHIVPTMFVRLLRLPDEVKQRYDHSSLRWVTHGAAPCAPAVKRQMIDWWGPVITEYYGATETGVVVGYQDADGYVFLCDRKRDMNISGGVNIYPAEIESVLIQMPEVRYCAVFGIPDDEFGEQICAHVEPQVGVALDAAQVRGYLA